MKSSQQPQYSRINITDLKAQIVKKLGPERSKQYFYYLNRLLSSKLSKGEFDKFCFRVLGRENLPLHNQLIRSILKNAHHARTPPPIYVKEVPLKSSGAVAGKKHESSLVTDVHFQQKRPTKIQVQTPGGPTSNWSNGDVLSMSPRKARSAVRDRRPKDHLSPLGRDGRTDMTSQLPVAALDTGGVKAVSKENGDLNHCDLKRPQHLHELAQQPATEQPVLVNCSTKSSQTNNSPDNRVSVHSIASTESLAAKDAGNVVQNGASTNTGSLFRVPLGIPFCSASVGGARRAISVASSSDSMSFLDSNELCDTETLRKRMEQIAETQGLGGVAMDCANLLNTGLDSYLKHLIRSCISLTSQMSGHEPLKHCLLKQPDKLINGTRPGHMLQMQTSNETKTSKDGVRSYCPLSLSDFKVAMELNPQQLGEDWPLLLEKICTRAGDE
ncbi:hypothetical protein Syun_031567 [Stephania yunnanensis]|uniref:Transcriptional coactivator Hfi1/Transcriptional adapter 1 n=1 Tax=Stephania yunnanensis TaxID=152371 RepID=A0AAP0E0X6_9MAGN